MKKFIPAFFLLLFLAITTGDLRGEEAGGYDRLLYNQVRQKASHNSYQRHQDILSQMVYHKIRTIEFDARVRTPGLVRGKVKEDDWRVYHNRFEPESNCRFLSDCLGQVSAFHQAVPGHEVVTIFFDVDFDPTHDRERFNALLRAGLPQGSVYTPVDLLGACQGSQTLQEAVDRCGWPLLSDLRGKFILVVSDGIKSLEKEGYDVREDAVFLVSRSTAGGSVRANPDRVFFNMSGPNPFAAEVGNEGFVSRAYYLDTPEEYDEARELGVNLLAMDEIDFLEYPWTITHNEKGWPFEVIGREEESAEFRESGRVMTVNVSGGRDMMLFWAREGGPSSDAAWSAYISGSSSPRDREARACLAAASGKDPELSFFAVCKAGDEKPLHAVWLEPGMKGPATRTGNVVLDDAVPEKSAIFVRLDITDDGKCAAGYGSVDGEKWMPIHERCFDAPLVLRGVAAEAGDRNTRFLIGELSQESSGEKIPLGTQDLDVEFRLGDGVSGTLADGLVP